MPRQPTSRSRQVNCRTFSVRTQLPIRRIYGRYVRRGTSLIEVVTAMSIASVMLLAAFRVLHTVLMVERTTTRAIFSSHSADRLARAFRTDIHAARNVETATASGDQPESMTLALANGESIRYEVETKGISRVARLHNQSTQRELFRFPESTSCRFERRANPDRVRLLLKLPRDPSERLKSSGLHPSRAAAPSDRLIPIEAVIARDHRFVGQQTTARTATP